MPEITFGEYTPGAAQPEIPDAGGYAETSLIVQPDDVAADTRVVEFENPVFDPDDDAPFVTQDVDVAAGTPLDTLYDKSTRDGSAFDTPVDVHISSGTSLDTLPGPPLNTPSSRPGDNIANLRDQVRAGKLDDAKKRLVNAFYKSLSEEYHLSPQKIRYDQFSISDNGRTLYWTPETGIEIRASTTKGDAGFLALSTLARNYGDGAVRAIKMSLGLQDYATKTQKVGELSAETKEEIRRAHANLPTVGEGIPLQDLSSVADGTIASIETITTALDKELTPEQSAALATINDPPLDVQWVSQASRELRGLGSAMTRTRDEHTNNVAKLSEVEKDVAEKRDHIALERKKLTETKDEGLKQDIEKRISELERELSDLLDVRAARLEAISATGKTLRSQVSRIRENYYRLLHEDKTLGERIRTLFREQGITIATILTALGMTISTLVLALTGGSGGGAVPTPPQPPQPPGKGGAREWIKKHLRSLGRALAKLAAYSLVTFTSWLSEMWVTLSKLGHTVQTRSHCPN
ncbi:hypothetical protein RRG08_058078 [Elysia crispata]|uniref:Uncharacterized protein n=1 Tax=Elysia crispata TaxID=231223 RepID=A0AAE0YI76_9GAST|nr:hypothetical protein RRG08_058078 [Elysia crispata]